MAYTMSVSQVSPADSATEQEWDAELQLSYSGDLLPWEFYVGGELKASFPIGASWHTSVDPAGYLNMTYDTWDSDTTYSWYVRYASSADTKSWNGSSWDFTGLSYATTDTRTFTTKDASYGVGPTPAHESTVSPASVTNLRVPVNLPYTWLEAGFLEKVGTGYYYVVNGVTYGEYPEGMTNFDSPMGFGVRDADSDWFIPVGDTEYSWYVVFDYDGSLYQSDTYTFTTLDNTLVELSAVIAGTSVIAITSGLPGAPTNPSPATTATGVNISTGFSWTNGSNTDTTAILMIIGGAGYVEIVSGLEEAAFSLVSDCFRYGISVAWKVKATNAYGSTTGDEWTFTCLDLDRPYPSYVLIEGGTGYGPDETTETPGVEGTDFLYTGENNMITTKALVAVANNRLWYSSF